MTNHRKTLNPAQITKHLDASPLKGSRSMSYKSAQVKSCQMTSWTCYGAL